MCTSFYRQQRGYLLLGFWLWSWNVSFALAEETTRSEPILTVQQKLPETIEPNKPFAVEIKIQNHGPVAVDGVLVTDLLPDGLECLSTVPAATTVQGVLSWSLGRIAAGEEQLITLRLQTQKEIPVSRLAHTVDVSYQTKVRHTALTQVMLREPTWKIIQPPYHVVGLVSKIQIQVHNPGTLPIHKLVLHSDLSAGLSHPSGKDLENELGTLEPGQRKEITLQVTPTKNGDQSIRLKLQAEQTKSMDETLRISVDAERFSLSVHGPKELKQQQSGLFEMIVHNQGGITPDKLILEVQLPESMHFNHGTDQASYDRKNHRIRWELKELQAGEKRAVVWNGTAKTTGEVDLKIGLQTAQTEYEPLSYRLRVIANGLVNRN